MKNKNVFIIGAGATASIVKMFCPNAKTIAPSGRSFLPVHYVWNTPETQRFMKDFKIMFHDKSIKVFKGTRPEEIVLYNQVTHKPINNKPSKGKKQISTLVCMLPDFATDIIGTVLSIDDKHILFRAIDGEEIYVPYDLVFICSPLLFKPYPQIKYYPMRIYKCECDLKKFNWDYAYLGGKLLENNIYRASKEEKYLFMEQAGDIDRPREWIEKWFEEFFGVKIKVIDSFVNKYAHFDVPEKINKDTTKIIYASRLSNLNNEFLFSDLIKKMYSLKKKKVI